MKKFLSVALVICLVLVVLDLINVSVEVARGAMTPHIAARQAQMRANVLATNEAAAARQHAWEAQVFAASPNVVAKRTTMISPANSRGQIIVVDVLSYYVDGRLMYATNVFEKVP